LSVNDRTCTCPRRFEKDESAIAKRSVLAVQSTVSEPKCVLDPITAARISASVPLALFPRREIGTLGAEDLERVSPDGVDHQPALSGGTGRSYLCS
jgi:hypothetical protein